MTEKRIPLDQELLDVTEAARFCGVSRSYFDEHIRRLLPMIDLRAPGAKLPLVRYSRKDLNAFIDSRRKTA